MVCRQHEGRSCIRNSTHLLAWEEWSPNGQDHHGEPAAQSAHGLLLLRGVARGLRPSPLPEGHEAHCEWLSARRAAWLSRQKSLAKLFLWTQVMILRLVRSRDGGHAGLVRLCWRVSE